MPIKIFCCYAHEDETLLKQLKAHLSPLLREGIIDVWYDGDISAGTDWEQQIKEQLNTAQIVLLLVSPDFMNSDYCYGIEMKRALERHERREARVIPVILRPIYWHGALGRLQALPKDALPVTDPDWHGIDRAFYNVTEGLRKVVTELTRQSSNNLPAMPPQIQKSELEELPREVAPPLLAIKKTKEQWIAEGQAYLHTHNYNEAFAAYKQAYLKYETFKHTPSKTKASSLPFFEDTTTKYKKMFSKEYPSVVLAFILALEQHTKGIAALKDIPHGIIMKANVYYSGWGVRKAELTFEITNESSSTVVVNALYWYSESSDYGRGKKLLLEIFKTASDFLTNGFP